MKRILDWKLFNESVSSELDEDIKWALIDLIDYGFKITQIDHHKYDHVSPKGEYDTEIEELLISLNLKQTVVWSSINSINVKFDIDGSFEVYELNAFYDGASKPKSEYDEIEDIGKIHTQTRVILKGIDNNCAARMISFTRARSCV